MIDSTCKRKEREERREEAVLGNWYLFELYGIRGGQRPNNPGPDQLGNQHSTVCSLVLSTVLGWPDEAAYN